MEAILFSGQNNNGLRKGRVLPTLAKWIYSKVLQDLLTNAEHLPMLRDHEKLLEITDEQVRLTMTVVQIDYWQMSCWTCSGEGYHTFTRSFLKPSQKIHF